MSRARVEFLCRPEPNRSQQRRLLGAPEGRGRGGGRRCLLQVRCSHVSSCQASAEVRQKRSEIFVRTDTTTEEALDAGFVVDSQTSTAGRRSSFDCDRGRQR